MINTSNERLELNEFGLPSDLGTFNNVLMNNVTHKFKRCRKSQSKYVGIKNVVHKTTFLINKGIFCPYVGFLPSATAVDFGYYPYLQVPLDVCDPRANRIRHKFHMTHDA